MQSATARVYVLMGEDGSMQGWILSPFAPLLVGGGGGKGWGFLCCRDREVPQRGPGAARAYILLLLLLPVHLHAGELLTLSPSAAP